MSDPISVTVTVPSHRHAEFHTFYGAWLTGDLILKSELEEETDEPPPRDLDEWRLPKHILQDHDNDIDLAREILAKFSDAAKSIFSVLSHQPTVKISGWDLAKKAGLKNTHAMAGALSWPGKHCYAAGKKLPFEWEKDPDGHTTYWMEKDVAQLFRWAVMSRKSLEETAKEFAAALDADGPNYESDQE